MKTYFHLTSRNKPKPPILNPLTITKSSHSLLPIVMNLSHHHSNRRDHLTEAVVVMETYQFSDSCKKKDYFLTTPITSKKAAMNIHPLINKMIMVMLMSTTTTINNMTRIITTIITNSNSKSLTINTIMGITTINTIIKINRVTMNNQLIVTTKIFYKDITLAIINIIVIVDRMNRWIKWMNFRKKLILWKDKLHIKELPIRTWEKKFSNCKNLII